MKLIESHLQKIFELCRLHKVRRLFVFGSILATRFSDKSDVDLLVDFEAVDLEESDYVSNYFKLQEAFERLFGRKVDFVVEKGL